MMSEGETLLTEGGLQGLQAVGVGLAHLHLQLLLDEGVHVVHVGELEGQVWGPQNVIFSDFSTFLVFFDLCAGIEIC